MDHKKEIKNAFTKSLASSKKAKTQVAQCCAKTSAIVAGCHD